MRLCLARVLFFFFSDTATTEIYTLSLHDALPISPSSTRAARRPTWSPAPSTSRCWRSRGRSEEHTSELQSRPHLVCRLLLEKKKTANSERTFTWQCVLTGRSSDDVMCCGPTRTSA